MPDIISILGSSPVESGAEMPARLNGATTSLSGDDFSNVMHSLSSDDAVAVEAAVEASLEGEESIELNEETLDPEKPSDLTETDVVEGVVEKELVDAPIAERAEETKRWFASVMGDATPKSPELNEFLSRGLELSTNAFQSTEGEIPVVTDLATAKTETGTGLLAGAQDSQLGVRSGALQAFNPVEAIVQLTMQDANNLGRLDAAAVSKGLGLTTEPTVPGVVPAQGEATNPMVTRVTQGVSNPLTEMPVGPATSAQAIRLGQASLDGGTDRLAHMPAGTKATHISTIATPVAQSPQASSLVSEHAVQATVPPVSESEVSGKSATPLAGADVANAMKDKPIAPASVQTKANATTSASVQQSIQSDPEALSFDAKTASVAANQPSTQQSVMVAAGQMSQAKPAVSHEATGKFDRAVETASGITNAESQTSSASVGTTQSVSATNAGLQSSTVASLAAEATITVTGGEARSETSAMSTGEAPTRSADPSPAQQLAPNRAPEVARDIARQIAPSIVASADGTVDIALSPKELGNIRMSLQLSESGVTLIVHGDRPDTIELMRRHAEELGATFREMGYEDISFSFTTGDDAGSTGDRPDDLGTASSGSELSDELTTNTEVADETAAVNGAVTDGGLDLRL